MSNVEPSHQGVSIFLPQEASTASVLVKYWAWMPRDGFRIEEGEIAFDDQRGDWIDPLAVNKYFAFDLLEIPPINAGEAHIEAIVEFANRYGSPAVDKTSHSIDEWDSAVFFATYFMDRFEFDSRSGPVLRPGGDPGKSWSALRNTQHILLLESGQMGVTLHGSAAAAHFEAWRYVAAKQGFVRCGYCRKWMEHEKEGGKASRRFCSDRCRTAELRQRRHKAVELTAQGKKPKEIATELRTTAANVRKWVAAAKKNRGSK